MAGGRGWDGGWLGEEWRKGVATGFELVYLIMWLPSVIVTVSGYLVVVVNGPSVGDYLVVLVVVMVVV